MELQNDLNSNSNVTPGSVSVNYSDDAVCWKLFMKKPKAITTRSYSESNSSSTSDSYNNTNSSTTGSHTRSVNKTTSKFTVYHYRLLFTPVHNDTTARWPTTHLLKNVKKWIVERNLFKEDFMDFKIQSPHSFEIVSKELLPTPLPTIKDPNLGWAQIFRAPSWNSNSFIVTSPKNTTDLEYIEYSAQLGSIDTWRRIPNPSNESQQKAIFWFTSLSPLMLVFLFKTRKQRDSYERTIFPTTSTSKLTCSNCTLPFHKTKCPFPDPSKDLPSVLHKFVSKPTSVEQITNLSMGKSYADVVADSITDSIKDQVTNTPSNIQTLLGRIAALEAELKTERHRNELLSEFYDSDQKAIIDTTLLLSESVKRTSELDKMNRILESDNLKLCHDIASLHNSNLDYEDRNSCMANNIVSLEKSCKTLSAQNNDLKCKLASPSLDNYTQLSTELNNRKAEIDKKFKDLQVERFELNNSVNSLRDRENKIVKMETYLTKKQGNLKNELAILHKAQEENKTKDQLRVEWQLTHDQKVNMYSAQVTERDNDIKVLKSDIFFKGNEIQTLKNQIQSMRSFIEQNNSYLTPKSKSNSLTEVSSFSSLVHPATSTFSPSSSSSKYLKSKSKISNNTSEIKFNNERRKSSILKLTPSTLSPITSDPKEYSLLTSEVNPGSHTTGELEGKLNTLRQKIQDGKNMAYLTHSTDSSNTTSTRTSPPDIRSL